MWILFSRKFAQTILIIFLTFSLNLSAEPNYLSEAKKKTTQEEFQSFLQSLNKKELLEFGKQTGEWIINNRLEIQDISWDILMYSIVNQYVQKYPEVCSYPSEFVAVFSSKRENSVLRSTFISWLREKTNDIPNCFLYFQKPDEVFEALNRIITDFSDEINVRSSAIITTSALLKITFWDHEHKRKWSDKYFAFIKKWLQQSTTHYLKILDDPKEDRRVLIDIINGLRAIYEYVDSTTKTKVTQVIQKCYKERRQYSPDVQLAILSWIARVLKDRSVEQELTNLATEYPEFADSVESIHKDLQKIK